MSPQVRRDPSGYELVERGLRMLRSRASQAFAFATNRFGGHQEVKIGNFWVVKNCQKIQPTRDFSSPQYFLHAPPPALNELLTSVTEFANGAATVSQLVLGISA